MEKCIKYVPKLFNTDMVKSIQKLIKNQTRRTKGLKTINENPSQWEFISLGPNPENETDISLYAYFKTGSDTWTYAKSEAKVGDIFWVRETTAEMFDFENHPELDGNPREQWDMGFWYKTDGGLNDAPFYIKGHKWKPSIFMPKAACRIFLKVTNVRVERLHDISEEDAKAEGIERIHVEIAPSPHNDMAGSFDYAYVDYMHRGEYAGWGGDAGCCRTAKESFFTLWESINGRESLESNPWVFVYDFELTDKPENF